MQFVSKASGALQQKQPCCGVSHMCKTHSMQFWTYLLALRIQYPAVALSAS